MKKNVLPLMLLLVLMMSVSSCGLFGNELEKSNVTISLDDSCPVWLEPIDTEDEVIDLLDTQIKNPDLEPAKKKVFKDFKLRLLNNDEDYLTNCLKVPKVDVKQ